MTIETHSIEETKTFAAEFSKNLHGGELVLLTGPLGAGKTAFVQGLVEALGGEAARSPSFSIMNIYRVQAKAITQLVHLDFYRVKNPNELDELGLHEFTGRPDIVVCVEWPPEALAVPAGTPIWQVTIDATGDVTRKISIERAGNEG